MYVKHFPFQFEHRRKGIKYLQETPPPILTNVEVENLKKKIKKVMKKRGKESSKEVGLDYLGVELQFLAEEVLIFGVNVVIEEIEEPGNAGEGDDDGRPSGGSLLGNLKVTAARVLLQIEVEQLVLDLQRFAQQFDVVSATAATAGVALHRRQ